MAASRSFFALLIASTLGVPAFAQEPPPPPEGQRPEPPKEEQRPNFPRRPFFGRGPEGKGGPDWKGSPGNPGGQQPGPDGAVMRDRAMREIQKLTPEQRSEVWRCVWAVLNLPAEKRQQLLGQDDDRRKKMREQIEQALKDNGIELNDENKRRFFHRYFEERRAIEEKLRKDEAERRQALMREMAEKLKKEFSAAPATPPVPEKSENK